VSFFGTRRLVDKASGKERTFWTRHDAKISGPIRFDVNAWIWEEFGEFTLMCEGRGSPGETLDSWWWSMDGWRNVCVEYQESGLGLGSRQLESEGIDEYMPDGRLEFSFQKQLVPPGRYKVIPWPGAPAKYCGTFEVRSGQHTEVVVKGG
jgi:hypothetical protein